MKYSSNVFVNRIKSFGAGWMGPTQIALDGFGFLCAMLAIVAIAFSELPLWYMAGPGIAALMFIVHGVIQVVHFRNCRDVSTGNVNRIGLSMKGVFSLVTGIIRSVLFVVAGVVCVYGYTQAELASNSFSNSLGVLPPLFYLLSGIGFVLVSLWNGVCTIVLHNNLNRIEETSVTGRKVPGLYFFSGIAGIINAFLSFAFAVSVFFGFYTVTNVFVQFPSSAQALASIFSFLCFLPVVIVSVLTAMKYLSYAVLSPLPVVQEPEQETEVNTPDDEIPSF